MDTRKQPMCLLFTVLVVSFCYADIAYSATAPCELLTQNQVSTIVGGSVGPASPIANTGCSWTATGATKVTVTVSMQSEKMFAAAKAASSGKETPVSGVGDEAIFIGVQNFSSLWAR